MTTTYAVTDDVGAPWGMGRTEESAWHDSLSWLDPDSRAARSISKALGAARLPQTQGMTCKVVTESQIKEWRKRGFHVGY